MTWRSPENMRRDFGLALHPQERQNLLGLERDPQRMREGELAAPGEVGRTKNRRTFGFRGVRGAHGQRPASLGRWGRLSSGELCGAGGTPEVAALAERGYVERLILRSRRPAGQRGWLPRQLARASNNSASRVTVAQFRIVQTTPSVESNQELVSFERATPLGRLR